MDDKPVAPRFSLKLPMRYRPVGDSRWRDTTTRNLSSSGALFVAVEPLPPGRKLEIEISMIAASPLKACRLVGSSEVVRQGSEDAALLTAIRYLHYETLTEHEQTQSAAQG